MSIQEFVLRKSTRWPGHHIDKAPSSLNDLSNATHIHILEPQWNPWIESQAVGRLYRHGQSRKVQITRYICHNTIEEVSVNHTLGT